MCSLSRLSGQPTEHYFYLLFLLLFLSIYLFVISFFNFFFHFISIFFSINFFFCSLVYFSLINFLFYFTFLPLVISCLLLSLNDVFETSAIDIPVLAVILYLASIYSSASSTWCYAMIIYNGRQSTLVCWVRVSSTFPLSWRNVSRSRSGFVNVWCVHNVRAGH